MWEIRWANKETAATSNIRKQSGFLSLLKWVWLYADLSLGLQYVRNADVCHLDSWETISVRIMTYICNELENEERTQL